MPCPKFIRKQIGELENTVGSSAMNTLFNVADVNQDGRLDIFTSGRNGRMAWFENRGDGQAWERHIIAPVEKQECGGLAYDLTGNGWLDIINGGEWNSDELCWWENPGTAGSEWTHHLIAKTGFGQFHDELIGDVTGNGVRSLVFWNQRAGALSVVPIPADPRISPWSPITQIASEMREKGQPEEGLAIVDLDGDGQNEIVAGTHWYKFHNGEWQKYKYAEDYITTVIAVGDVDGDGSPEIVISEGDACIYGYPEGGKLGIWKPKAGKIHELWEEHRLDENLLDPHSLLLAPLCGTDRLDILVGEIGKRDTLEQEPPRILLYENQGGNFTTHVIDQGTGVHHARLADFRGVGLLDIASRPLHGADKWKIFVWENQGI